MTMLPDTVMPEGPLRAAALVPAHHREDTTESGLRRAAYKCLGLSAMVAALGLWIVPVVPGDAMMQLVKLVFSAALVIGGCMLYVARKAPRGPVIEIDPRRRLITMIDLDADGREVSREVHEIDALNEIVLRDGLLTARDAGGRPLIALPVIDPATHAALSRMLTVGAPRAA